MMRKTNRLKKTGLQCLKTLLAVFLCLALTGCTKRQTDWARDPDTGRYRYPVTQDSAEWAAMERSERIRVCDIPKAVLEDMTDEELAVLVLEYPLLEETLCYDSFMRGVSAVSTFFPPLAQALHSGAIGQYLEENPAISEQSGTLQLFALGYAREYAEDKWMDDAVDLLSVEWRRSEQTGCYFYPVTEASEEWLLLNGAGRYAVCDIPKAVLEDMTDEELAVLVLEYPLLASIYFGSSHEFQTNLDALAGRFSGLAEALRRDALGPFLRSEEGKAYREAETDRVVCMFIDDYLAYETQMKERADG